MEQRDILKINRQLLLLTRQMAKDSDAAELMTGLSKPVIDKIATLDMEEIEELATTVGVSLYTLRFTDSVFARLLQLPPDARSTYAGDAGGQQSWRRYFPLRSWKIIG
jgi:flagellar transcriptional activator FlhD